MYSVHRTVHSVHYSICIRISNVYKYKYIVYTVQCVIYSIYCTLYIELVMCISIQYTVYTVHCTVYSVQCTVCNVQYKVTCISSSYRHIFNSIQHIVV